jgi:hypothetical protein
LRLGAGPQQTHDQITLFHPGEAGDLQFPGQSLQLIQVSHFKIGNIHVDCSCVVKAVCFLG